MRIISKFSDYYDAGMGHGQDMSLVFLRLHQAYPWAHSEHLSPAHWTQKEQGLPASLLDIATHVAKKTPKNRSVSNVGGAHMHAEMTPGIILFAGRMYPYTEVRLQPNSTYGRGVGPTIARKVFYAEADLMSYFHELGHDLILPAGRDWLPSWERQDWKTFYTAKGSDELLPACVASSLAVAHFNKCADPTMFEVNPALKPVEFFRVLDSWQAFQELSMFVGNLAQPGRAMVVISEKEKVAKHGFDEWSFRKMPQA